jgi:hypothetical protein
MSAAGGEGPGPGDGAIDGRKSLEARAEVLKLARLLNREPATLCYLDAVPAGGLRELREQITEVLFASSGKTLMRLATASKLLPAGVVAVIAERAFGPLLAARVTGLLEPHRAVDVAAKLPPEFLADVAVELDPRRASKVIAAIPAPQVRLVTRELINREEYITIGRFVGHLPDASVRAALDVIDDAALLRIAFVLEHKDRMDDLLEFLGRQRFAGLIAAAASPDLWPEALDLLSRVNAAHQRELIELARRRDPAPLSRIREFARRSDPQLYRQLLESVEGSPG